MSPHISSPTSVGLGMEGLILVIEPLTGQGDSCLALSAKFRLGTLPLPAGQVGSPPAWVYLMALIGTKQSSLLWPSDETLVSQKTVAPCARRGSTG